MVIYRIYLNSYYELSRVLGVRRESSSVGGILDTERVVRNVSLIPDSVLVVFRVHLRSLMC
jgi:hypothetical protein